MISVLFIHHGRDWVRGSENGLLLILQYLDTTRFQPYVISNNMSFLNRLKDYNIHGKYVYIPEIMVDPPCYKFQLFQYVKFVYFLLRFIKKHSIQLLYSNSGLPTQAGFVVSRLLRIPIITHIRSPINKRYALLWLFKYANKVLFVCHSIKRSLCRKIQLKCPPCVVYNAIDINFFYPKKDVDMSHRIILGIRENDVVIGQVGSLIYRKGCDLLIHAFSRLLFKYDNIKLVFVGDGEDSESLQELVKRLNIQNHVYFVGNTDDTRTYYQDVFDINVLASRSEAFSRALLEAGACGLPLVASRCGGNPELVYHWDNGLLFTPNESRDLYRQLDILVSNPELRAQMGASARKHIVDNFSIREHMHNIQEVMENTYYRTNC
jgi:glycosyltransferase involved in cell wall biosynthesis